MSGKQVAGLQAHHVLLDLRVNLPNIVKIVFITEQAMKA